MYAEYAYDTEVWNDQFDGCPKEFLVGLLKAMVKLRLKTGDTHWWNNSRSYHEEQTTT